MDYVNEQVTDPAEEPEVLAMVKKHCAIDHTDDDDILTQDIKAAREYCEVHTGRVFGARTFRLSLPKWPDDAELRIPVEPVNSITSLTYKDVNNVAQVVAASSYRTWLRHSPPIVRLTTGFAYPTLELDEPASVILEYVAGEVTIPVSVKKAIQLIVEYWREYPGGETSLPHLSRGIPGGVIRLLDSLWTGAL